MLFLGVVGTLAVVIIFVVVVVVVVVVAVGPHKVDRFNEFEYASWMNE